MKNIYLLLFLFYHFSILWTFWIFFRFFLKEIQATVTAPGWELRWFCIDFWGRPIPLLHHNFKPHVFKWSRSCQLGSWWLIIFCPVSSFNSSTFHTVLQRIKVIIITLQSTICSLSKTTALGPPKWEKTTYLLGL